MDEKKKKCISKNNMLNEFLQKKRQPENDLNSEKSISSYQKRLKGTDFVY